MNMGTPSPSVWLSASFQITAFAVVVGAIFGAVIILHLIDKSINLTWLIIIAVILYALLTSPLIVDPIQLRGALLAEAEGEIIRSLILVLITKILIDAGVSYLINGGVFEEILRLCLYVGGLIFILINTPFVDNVSTSLLTAYVGMIASSVIDGIRLVLKGEF